MTGRLVAFLALAALAGCSPTGVDNEYGRSTGRSVNGTGVLAEALRAQGHTVRATQRLDDRLERKSDVLVRFATYPGPPGLEEAEWYEDWLAMSAGRKLIYVMRDYDAEPDYWKAVLAGLPADTDPAKREAISDRAATAGRMGPLPPKAKAAGRVESWFALEPNAGAPTTCQALGGAWAIGVDGAKARVERHEVPKATVENVLLTGDGKTLAMEWHLQDSKVLLVANGSFLLNAALLERARRPLAERVVEWVGEEPRDVVFVQGSFLLDSSRPKSQLPLTPAMRWVLYHILAFALIGCLARTARLGRPRPAPVSDAERPVAHAEALGDLLAKTRDTTFAQTQIETYRRWRVPSAHQPNRNRALGP